MANSGTTQIGNENVSYSPSSLGYDFRDFSRGVYRKYSIAQSQIPPNSVSHAINWNFDTIVGSAVVRPGTTLLGTQIVASKSPLGLVEFTTGGSAIQDVVTAMSDGKVYYYDTSWHTSGLTTLSTTAKVRFAQLGNQLFLANGVVMKSSVDGNTWGTTNTITTNTVLPSLLYRVKGRLLASGDLTGGAGHSRSRVYFSSIVDPSTSPGGITWNTDPTVGNWIDVNPDDGSDITAFAEASGLVLVFKDKYIYRLDAINNTVDLNNVYPFGAVSQEAVVNCQGKVYFFTGQDIQVTDGSFPTQISRFGIQDFLDAIPQTSWSSVAAGTDGQNVYFSIGNVTVPATGFEAVTYNRVVLKFSVRDQNWSVHSYAGQFNRFCQFTTSGGRTMVSIDTLGNAQTINSGTTDNGTAINYDIQTQELDFGQRNHQKAISAFTVFMKYGLSSQLQVKSDEGDFVNVPGNPSFALSDRINNVLDASLKANYFTFRLIGSSFNQAPIFEGFYFENVSDKGFIKYAPN